MKTGHKYLDDLTRNLSVITGPQALRAYFGNDLGAMRKTLRTHQTAGLIELTTELVRRRELDSPIAVIRPGDPLPSPHQIAYLAQQRWSDLSNPVLTIRGTCKLAALYGGEHRPIISGQLSHEVAISDVFLFSKRIHDPGFEWTLVNSIPGGGALPDAVASETAIEVVGQYNGATISAKLGISANFKLELW